MHIGKGSPLQFTNLAHELAHALEDAEGRQLVTDGGYHFFCWRRLVSYTTGGVAECTYREASGGLARQSMRECMTDASSHPATCRVGP